MSKEDAIYGFGKLVLGSIGVVGDAPDAGFQVIRCGFGRSGREKTKRCLVVVKDERLTG